MTPEQYEEVKATFPWTHRVHPTRSGGLVQVIDRTGAEVPLFAMCAFLDMITGKIAQKAEAKTGEASPIKE